MHKKLEVDLFRQGIDLLDFYRGRLSLRRLVVFSLELGNDSLLMKELGWRELGDKILWDHKDYLAAANANSSRELVYLTALNLWGKGGGKGERPKPPDPIHPPGYVPEKPKMSTREDFAVFAALISKG